MRDEPSPDIRLVLGYGPICRSRETLLFSLGTEIGISNDSPGQERLTSFVFSERAISS